MKYSRIFIVLFFSFVVLLVSCDDKSLSPTKPKGPDFSSTPMENEEAELLAAYLSGEIVAPISLYHQLNREIALIRDTWEDSVPYVKIKYFPPFEPSVITLGFTTDYYDSIVAGQYHYWDSLNSYYRLKKQGFHSFGNSLELFFGGRLNSLLLVDAYAGLPGMRYVNLNSWAGDWPVLLAIKDETTIKYFFRDAGGDCPSGCVWSDFFYFTVVDDSARFIGNFILDYTSDSIPPSWLDTAITALKNYREGNSWRLE